MKTAILRPVSGFALALAVACALGAASFALPATAEARERPARVADRAAPRGDFQRRTERARTANGHTRQDTWTGADGRSATRDAVVVNDRDAGTRTRDVTWTGPDGAVATRRDVTAKTESGYERSSAVTGPSGKTTTRESSLVRDAEAGTRTRAATTTLPDGRTRSMDDVVTRTENGYVRDTTIVNPNGATLQRDVVATRDPATGAWVKDVAVDRTPAPAPGN